MQTVLHKAEDRGRAEHGWLHSWHSFSFAHFYDAQRMGFGKLRVLNDDFVEPGAGFDTHGHDNMEIVTVPLRGAMEHKDSMGHTQVIRAGEVQAMSAGSGLTHSEYNASDTEDVNFLQIWVIPKHRDTEPGYRQRQFDAAERHNRWQVVVSPDEADSVTIDQDAWFVRGDFDGGETAHYTLHGDDHGVYVFVIDGGVTIGGKKLQARDAIGVSGVSEFDIDVMEASELLLIEVPMQ